MDQIRKFLRAAFKISLIEVLAILGLGATKYVLVTYGIADKISRPFIWLCFGAAILFLVGVVIIGIVEAKGKSFERWEAEVDSSKKKWLIVTFVKWAQVVPILMACILFIYVIAPTTLAVFLAFIFGIILRNSILFFKQKSSATKQELN